MKLKQYTKFGTQISQAVLIALGLLFLLLTNLSYLNYAVHSTPEYRFTGSNPYTAADKLVYMSMVEQGREGILFMKNIHSSEPQVGRMFSPHWYFIGQTGKWLNISNNAAYQIYRVVFAVIFLFIIYVLLRKLFRGTWDHVGAAVFVLFSGGLGWLILYRNPEIALVGSTTQKYLLSPSDLYVTEGNTLLNFSQSPLFSLSQIILLLIFYLFITYRKKIVHWTDGVVFGVVLVLSIIHPYDLPILLAVTGTLAIWFILKEHSYRSLIRLWPIALAGILAIWYNLYIVSQEYVLAEWLKQNLVFSPSLHLYLLGYGLLVPFWIIGVYVVFRYKRDNPWWVLAAVWSCLVWILLYVPLDQNRRFINGFHIALSLVSYAGFRYILDQIQKRWLKVIYACISFVVLLSSIGFFLYINLYFNDSVYTYGYYYISFNEDQVIEFIKNKTQPEDSFLTSDELTAFTITSQVNRVVYRGHSHQTPHTHLKDQKINWFFEPSDTEEATRRKVNFLYDEGLDYIVINQDRNEYSSDWLRTAPFLTIAYSNPDLIVYKVETPE